MPEFPRATYPWSGPLEEYVAEFVVPWWPRPEQVAAWTEAALAWHERPDSLLYVRSSVDKGWLHQVSGRRVVHTDNSPGIWVLLRARDEAFSASSWDELVEGGRIPVLKMRSRGRTDRPWTHARTALTAGDAKVLWSRKLKHCHVFDMGRRTSSTLVQRSLRNVAALNHFVFPNGAKHFNTSRDGWSDEVNTIDLGESATVCAYVFHELVKRVRAVAPGLPERFLLAAGESMPKQPNGNFRLTISPRVC